MSLVNDMLGLNFFVKIDVVQKNVSQNIKNSGPKNVGCKKVWIKRSGFRKFRSTSKKRLVQKYPGQKKFSQKKLWTKIKAP